MLFKQLYIKSGVGGLSELSFRAIFVISTTVRNSMKSCDTVWHFLVTTIFLESLGMKKIHSQEEHVKSN